jgi:hypothetical protein
MSYRQKRQLKILEVEVEYIQKFLLLQVRDNHLIYNFFTWYVLKWCFSTKELKFFPDYLVVRILSFCSFRILLIIST